MVACSTTLMSKPNPPPPSPPSLPSPISTSLPPPPLLISPQPLVQTSNTPQVVKIGIILGPGAIKTFAHIGALQEISKAKLPVTGIVGIEMGSLIGALYAQKGQIFEPEWQMLKIKEDELIEKSLLGTIKQKQVNSFDKFIKMAFADRKNEDAKMSFSCPTLNTSNNSISMMSKGAYSSILPYCLPIPPLFNSFNHNIAAVHDLKTSADYLRTQGATYIILINVIDTNLSDEHPFWSVIAHSLLQQSKNVDYIIQIPLNEFSLTDFDKRREMIQRGRQTVQKLIGEIQNNLGL